MSEKNLGQLIASLKSEAIEASEKEAAKILEEAKAKADGILHDANQQKSRMLEEAQKEADDIVDKGKLVLQQAARDLTLTLQSDLINLFKNAFETEVKAEFKAELVKDVVKTVVDSIGKDVEIGLPSETYKELADFAQNNAQNIAITEDKGMFAGLKVTKTSEGWSYDLNPETITEATKDWFKYLS